MMRQDDDIHIILLAFHSRRRAGGPDKMLPQLTIF